MKGKKNKKHLGTFSGTVCTVTQESLFFLQLMVRSTLKVQKVHLAMPSLQATSFGVPEEGSALLVALNSRGNNHRMPCRQSSSPELYNLIWLHSLCPGNQTDVNKLLQWLQGLAQLAVCSECKCAAPRSQSSSAPAQQIRPGRSTSACSSSQPFCCLMPTLPRDSLS